MLSPCRNAIPHVQSTSPATLANVTLSSLLPSSRQYFNYAGSLTTPGCNESERGVPSRACVCLCAAVTLTLLLFLCLHPAHCLCLFSDVNWVVMESPGSISPAQLSDLSRAIADVMGGHSENNRPLQPLNGRPVYRGGRPTHLDPCHEEECAVPLEAEALGMLEAAAVAGNAGGEHACGRGGLGGHL